MTSNMFSRFLPQSTAPSVYETLRQADEQSDESDLEERAGLAFDGRSDDMPISRGKRPGGIEETSIGPSRYRDESPEQLRSPASRPSQGTARSPEWLRSRISNDEDDEANDDVPMSLLVEDESPEVSPSGFRRLPPRPSSEPEHIPVSGQPSENVRARWNAAQQQQGLQEDPSVRPAYAGRPPGVNPLLLADENEKAMWRWTNVTNLDNFLKDVYEYYIGNGIYSIVLSRVIELLTLAFVVGFGVFLTACINYSSIPGSSKMIDILVPKCTQRMSGFMYLAVCLASLLWFYKLFQHIVDMRRLWHLHNFYTYLLEIPERDIQTVNWQTVVGRLMSLRDQNPHTAAIDQRKRKFLDTQSKQRMDAHDIANRLMRRDNYLIALINKDVLDLNLHLPYFGKRLVFSKTLEWNLSFAILDFVFDANGQVNPHFLGSAQRRALSESLKSRFRFAATMNVICAPFLLIYLTLLYFFRYFNEYQKNPGQISARQYTPWAEWRFREFNELWHLFEDRLKMSDPFATRYINQFPKDKTIQVARFVGLVAGALASVLVLASLFDPDLFLNFEITHDRTVLFYTGVLLAVWQAARNAEPEDNMVFDPEYALETVIDYTHYQPAHWRGKLHSEEVRKDFATLYQVKLVIFLEELISIWLTPIILWYNLPSCSDRIIDFFREFTIHVDGLGYVCSFAVFDFNRGGNNLVQQSQAPAGGESKGKGKARAAKVDAREDYYAAKDNKMLQSYYNFVDAYVTNPDGKKGMAQHAHHHRKQFHPPPAYPGLGAVGASHHMVRENSPVADQRRPTATSRRGADLGLGSKSTRTPRFGPTSGGAPSPASSMLLDPQHHPISSSYRPPQHRSTMQSTLRKSRHVMNDVIGEEDEDALLPQGGGMGTVMESRASGGEEDSPLGESWKTTRAGALEEDGEGGTHEDEDGDAAGGGVLGMVYQFSKAQTRGGVQI